MQVKKIKKNLKDQLQEHLVLSAFIYQWKKPETLNLTDQIKENKILMKAISSSEDITAAKLGFNAFHGRPW